MRFLLPLLLVLPVFAKAQSPTAQSLPSDLTAVTVYRQGAVVTRTGQVVLPEGPSAVHFQELALNIDAESIQLRIDGPAAVFSLTAGVEPGQVGVVDPRETAPLYTEIYALRERRDSLQAEREGQQMILDVLAANQAFAGAEATAAVEDVARATALYRSRATAAHRALNGIARAMATVERRLGQLEAQMAGMAPLAGPDRGRVDARLLTEAAGTYDFELSYLVKDASWTPDYDLFVYGREVDTSDLVLVANVQQSTGIPWEGVALSLDAGDPNRRLRPGRSQPRYIGGAPSGKSRVIAGAYDASPRQVSGRIYDETGEPLIGANVMVEGTQVGTVTDIDGAYTLDLPTRGGGALLKISYVGYEAILTNVRSASMDFVLGEDRAALDEVVVVGYATQRRRSDVTASVSSIGGRPTYTPKPPPPPATFATESAALTSKRYAVSAPFSLPPDGQPLAVRLSRYPLPLHLRYRALPKVEAAVYLEGLLTDFDALGLISGPMRLHLEGRYLGRDYFDAATTSDTLFVPLGADSRIALTRKPMTRETDRRPVRGRVDYDMGYVIEVRNGLEYAIELHVEDQIPVVTRDEIDIALQEMTPAPEYDEDTGQLTWDLPLAPASTETLRVLYEISAPKDVRVDFE